MLVSKYFSDKQNIRGLHVNVQQDHVILEIDNKSI